MGQPLLDLECLPLVLGHLGGRSQLDVLEESRDEAVSKLVGVLADEEESPLE